MDVVGFTNFTFKINKRNEFYSNRFKKIQAYLKLDHLNRKGSNPFGNISFVSDVLG